MRVPLPIPVRVKMENSPGDIETTIQDISWGGILLNLSPLPAVGTRLLVEIDIPDQPVMLGVWGTVVRINEDAKGNANGAGVEFDELDHEGRSEIQFLVDNFVCARFRNQ